LFEKVFPLLAPATLDRIELLVVGEVRDNPRTKILLSLAAKFPQIKFLGFQEDILPFYASCDLQVVGSTAATGLRTRIIESMVYGVPVISTKIGAAGMNGLIEGQNILLAETPQEFAKQMENILTSSTILDQLAKGGTTLYRRLYSRPVVATKLAKLLAQHLKM
jgi:glycosyltransferase involved in cell wall biosynthesis